MNRSDSVAIDNVNVAHVARETAENAKTGGAILSVFLGLLAVAMLFGTTSTSDGGTLIAGYALWAAILGVPVSRYFGTARRAGRAIAAIDASSPHEFFLSDRMIVAVDPGGALCPDMSFKISKKLRATLLAVPRASIHRA